jgi:two-component system phosphate regulon sensor histidine kinase PhoR
MPETSTVPKPFLRQLAYNTVIWAALLAVIGWTIGGDPAWLGAIGIGGASLTAWAGWLAGRAADRDLGPASGIPAAGTDLGKAPNSNATHPYAAHPYAAQPYAALEALPLAVLVVDRQRDIRWANEGARQLLPDAAVGGSLLGVLRHPPLIDALDQVQGGVAAIDGIETPVGRDRLLVADLRRLDEERALIALKDDSAARRLERLRSDFIANVSHELKTPIATLMGFIETLRGPAKGDAAAHERFLGIMQEQAGRMSRLVADLLSLSRIELNEHARPMGSANLGEILGHVADALSLKAAERKMRIELPQGEAWNEIGRATGDDEELTQVFQNLIDNAVKYGRPGTPVIVSAARVTDPAEIKAHLPAARQAKAMIAICVADQGEGIAREHLPRLTERFYRIDAARSRDMGGTGLGLAIVKHIVNRHRGSLEIDSIPGEGSRFTVYLPLDENAGKLRAAS